MDSVTHALTGYAISCVLYDSNKTAYNKKLNTLKTSVVIGAICPDIDFVMEFFGGSTLYFMSHRTLTHTTIGIILLSLFCAAGIKSVQKGLSYLTLFLGALTGAISHILFDITNVYSTLAVWPFSNKMYSLGILPIIDAVILGVFIISILMCCVTPLKLHKRKVFTLALTLIIIYIGFKACMQSNLKNYLTDEYTKYRLISEAKLSKIQKVSVLTDYTGISSWNFIIENDKEYIKGNINYLSHSISGLEVIKKKAPDIAYERASTTPLGKFLLRFTPYTDYSVERYNNGYMVHIIDLRYTFPLRLSSKQTGYSHILGAYVILDQHYNPVSWTTKNPLDIHLQF